MTTMTPKQKAVQQMAARMIQSFDHQARSAKHRGAFQGQQYRQIMLDVITGRQITEAQALAAGFHPRVAKGWQASRISSGTTTTTTTTTPATRSPRELSAYCDELLREMYAPRSLSSISPGILTAIAPDLGGWQARDERAWSVAVHEAAHAVVALKVGAGVSYATVDRGGDSGRCMLTKLDEISVENHAAVDAAGAYAAGGLMQSNDAGTGDRDHYEERVAEAGNPAGFHDLAMGTAHVICSGFLPEILAVARLLCVNQGQHVSGDDIRFIMDFHAGKHPDLAEAIQHERSMARWR